VWLSGKFDLEIFTFYRADIFADKTTAAGFVYWQLLISLRFNII